MSKFRKGDEVSMRGLVTGFAVGEPVVRWSDGWSCAVDPKLLTLLRRAPVDLATCELPQDGSGVPVVGVINKRPGRMLSRFFNGACPMAIVLWPDASAPVVNLLVHLRPLDASAPAPDQSDMAAGVE